MANEIPLNDAIAQTTAWRTMAEPKLGTDFVKAFTIPMENYTQIQATGAVKVRAYLGEEPDGTKSLLLVGVDAQGNDMIDYANGQYVYDFTSPCPSSCANGSPLN